MTTRRLLLHLIVGLLTFLIGVTIAIALGGFDPLSPFTRSYSRHQYAIPQQSLLEDGARYENYRGCRHARPRTAELRYQYEPSMPPAPPAAPAVPDAPFFEEQEPPPPPARAPRANR